MKDVDSARITHGHCGSTGRLMSGMRVRAGFSAVASCLWVLSWPRTAACCAAVCKLMGWHSYPQLSLLGRVIGRECKKGTMPPTDQGEHGLVGPVDVPGVLFPEGTQGYESLSYFPQKVHLPVKCRI